MNKDNEYRNRPLMRVGSGDSFNVMSENSNEGVIPPDMQCPHCKKRAPKNWKVCRHCEKVIPGREDI